MESEYNRTKVDVSKEDKEALSMHIEEINKILAKYPYSMDMTCYFIPTMSRAKTSANELKQQIDLLSAK